jgi:hypothetical protein
MFRRIAANRMLVRGKKVMLALPRIGGDFNDYLLGAR